MTTPPNKMSDEELYQSITDICFENGGVTKPMADKLMQLIIADRKRVALEARIDALEYAKISPKFKIEERIEALKQELESL